MAKRNLLRPPKGCWWKQRPMLRLRPSTSMKGQDQRSIFLLLAFPGQQSSLAYGPYWDAFLQHKLPFWRQKCATKPFSWLLGAPLFHPPQDASGHLQRATFNIGSYSSETESKIGHDKAGFRKRARRATMRESRAYRIISPSTQQISWSERKPS